MKGCGNRNERYCIVCGAPIDRYRCGECSEIEDDNSNTEEDGGGEPPKPLQAAVVGNPEATDGKPAYVSEKVELSLFANWSELGEGDKLYSSKTVRTEIDKMRTEYREYLEEQREKQSDSLAEPMQENIRSNINGAKSAFTALTELNRRFKQE